MQWFMFLVFHTILLSLVESNHINKEIHLENLKSKLWPTNRTLTWKLHYNHSSYDPTKIREDIQQAFDDWARYTELTFRELLTEDEKADFNLAFVSGEHSYGTPFDELSGQISRSFPLEHPHVRHIHFDATKNWSHTYDGIGYNLRLVAAHEIGSSLGLLDSNDQNSIMSSLYQPILPNEMLLKKDQDGIQSLYGQKKSSMATEHLNRHVRSAKKKKHKINKKKKTKTKMTERTKKPTKKVTKKPTTTTEKKKNNHPYTMLHITNKKVAGFDVRWASFQGFSILFNNPGDHCLQHRSPGIYDLVNNVRSDPGLHFYKILEEGITRLGIDSLMNKFLFCALPSNSYHVTLWGGLNCKNVAQIDSQYRSMAENWLSGLPKSFSDASKDIFQLPSMSSLCTKRDWNVNFRFDRLNIWNNVVLVAAVRPDASSISTFKQLLDERHQLSKQFYDRFNLVTTSETYIPHVSLGYFANEEGAQKALDFVDDWNKWFNDALQDSILSFNNANIYGFTDMVSFFKEADK